ncbi:MAG: MurT ligase domain-containing protein [Bacilli bacterium]
MNGLIILLSKLSLKILKLKGKGSSYPGLLALKLNKNILTYFKLPQTVIFVTGTTGKTTISGALADVYTKNGYTVANNVRGSNLIYGVVTALIEKAKLNGCLKADAVIIEIDERYVKNVFKYITPKYFIINNLSRDQLARNGHFELVFDEINNSIDPKTKLFLNADDPLTVKFSLNKQNEIIYYGVKENIFSTKTNKLNTLDLAYCPNCYKKLEYSYFNYGNLGEYKCPNDDYKRPNPHYEAVLTNKKQFMVNNESIIMPNDALYNVYNLLACYALCKEDKIKDIVNPLNNPSLKMKRFTNFEAGKVKGTILLSKNETPLSYNNSVEYIASKKGLKTVMIGFTRISGKYDLKDLSWLYDINFELLNNKSIEKIILVGPFAYDLAVRLKQAKIDSHKFIYCLDYNNILQCLLTNTKSYIYCMLYFDLDDLLKKQLLEKGYKL